MSKKLNLLILSGLTILASTAVTTTLISNTSKAKDSHSSNATTLSSTTSPSTILDETVYVFTDTNGKTRRIISSDWSKTDLNTDQYTKVEDNSKSTPINISIKYTLNGQAISADEIAGKSGKVTIEFNYQNTAKQNGYFVPYAVMTGLLLDNDIFTNVEAENGRLLNDGSRTIAAGITLPGLQENLDISENLLNVPKSFKITADAQNFKLGITLSLVTTEPFQALDATKLNSIDSLGNELAQLQTGVNQLVDGSSELYKGLAQLSSQSAPLTSGIDQLATGSLDLSNGLATVNSGTDTLASGLTQLSAGLDQLATKNTALTAGASQTFSSLLQNAHDLIQTQINEALFSNALTQLATAVAQRSAANLPTPTELLNHLPTTEIQIPAFTQDNYEQILDYLSAEYPDYATTFQTSKAQLNAYRDNFLAGINQYTSGVDIIATSLNAQILPGVADLKSGTNQLYSGAIALSDGLATLNSNTPALTSGITQLKDGSLQLSTGLTQLNHQGISRLISTYDDLQTLSTRLKNVINLAKTHHPNTKYVYRTDEIN